jgi:G3E family GTPase
MKAIKAIPTNVITGFLGTGKTTAILHLLTQKPATERWAVLVNEFGEVGIDGSMFSGTQTAEQGVFVREVPGGCMCCASGLPMQIALNMLLTRARPHRLLIEPTGLGHPKEVLAVLRGEHYREVLDLRSTLTLVDARKIQDERYTSHDTFRQQLAIADRIIANKSDQYQAEDFPALLKFLEDSLQLNSSEVIQVSMGELSIDWLTAKAQQHHFTGHSHNHSESPSVTESATIPDAGYLSIDNAGDGFYSRGWIFSGEWVFDARKLYSVLLGLNTERAKGVFITDRGVIAFNKADNVLTENALDEAMDSRIECISADEQAFELLEDTLLECVIAKE